MDRERAAPYAALLGAQLLFATLPIAAKVGLQEVHFLVFSLVRMSGAALILAAVVLLIRRPPLPSRQDMGKLALYALFGIVVNQVLFLWGLSLTTATNAALIITSIPVFTYAIALGLGREEMSKRRGAGILVALSGVLLLLDPRQAVFGPEVLAGNLLVLVNSISYALYLVLSRPMVSRMGAMPMVTWLFLLGALITLPIAVAVVGLPASGPSWAIPPLAGLMLAYVIIGPTVGTYALNLFALSRVASSTVAAFIYLQPVAAVYLAWLLLGEHVGLVHFAAGGLVLAGVTLVSARRPGTPRKEG